MSLLFDFLPGKKTVKWFYRVIPGIPVAIFIPRSQLMTHVSQWTWLARGR